MWLSTGWTETTGRTKKEEKKREEEGGEKECVVGVVMLSEGANRAQCKRRLRRASGSGSGE